MIAKLAGKPRVRKVASDERPGPMRAGETGLAIACAVCMAIAVGPASADTLMAARPGLMCRSPEALAKLTLPDGSSRTARPSATASDQAVKQSGGCIDIPNGVKVTVVTARKDTSIVSFDATDGAGARTFHIPNIDFEPEQVAAPVSPSRSREAGANSADVFFPAMDQHCPRRRWRDANMGSYGGPLNDASKALSPAQSAAMERLMDSRCQDMGGLACPNFTAIDFLISAGRLADVVRAFCAVEPGHVQ